MRAGAQLVQPADHHPDTEEGESALDRARLDGRGCVGYDVTVIMT